MAEPRGEIYRGTQPTIADGAFVHASAVVIGDVEIGALASIWCNTVVRGDVNAIRIGARSNIQDGSVLHVSHKTPNDPIGAPLSVGANVTVGHLVILHGCTIGDDCLIGMGSIIMDHASLEPMVLLGAGSLVPEGKVLRSGYLYLGRPAKQIRALTELEKAYFAYSAEHYVKLAQSYRTSNL